MLAAITWNWDPILVNLGPLQIRYYGVMFALTIYTGFAVWRRQALRNGETHDFAEQFLWWGVIAIVGGSRLGHVLFYEPREYFMPWTRDGMQNGVWEQLPLFWDKISAWLDFLKFWRGGLASHGATVGLIVALWLFARKHGKTWFRLGDYLAPAIAIAAGGVRIGNFFNSEIVGRVTDMPWGVRFLRYCNIEHISAAQCLPRHPSQLYEFSYGCITFLILVLLQRADIRRAGSGLYAGTFFVGYFGQRIIFENFKEFQHEQLRSHGFLGTLEQALGVHLTTGQWLSIPLVVAGIALIVRALRQPKDAIPEPVPTPDVLPEPEVLASAKGKPDSKVKVRK